MDNFDNLTIEDIDKKIFELNKNKNLSDKSNTHKYLGETETYKYSIVNELEIKSRNPKGNKTNLRVKVNIKNVYRYMNSVINYIIGLNKELKYDDILERGLNKVDNDDCTTNYVRKLNEIRKNESICTTIRFSSWDSRDEDFHFLYECNEVYSITYSSDNDIRIGNLSHELKLHKHKVIGLALNYGAKSIMDEYDKRNTEIYNQICNEIKWFQDEYKIKTDNLSKRFELDINEHK